MARERTNRDFLNGIPELLVLRLLDCEPMYGYQLVRKIEVATNNQMQFGEGCIYPILHRLEGERVLVSRREKCDGRMRIVYRVTGKGKKRLTEATARWAHVMGSVEMVLHGAHYGQAVFA